MIQGLETRAEQQAVYPLRRAGPSDCEVRCAGVRKEGRAGYLGDSSPLCLALPPPPLFLFLSELRRVVVVVLEQECERPQAQAHSSSSSRSASLHKNGSSTTVAARTAAATKDPHLLCDASADEQLTTGRRCPARAGWFLIQGTVAFVLLPPFCCRSMLHSKRWFLVPVPGPLGSVFGSRGGCHSPISFSLFFCNALFFSLPVSSVRCAPSVNEVQK